MKNKKSSSFFHSKSFLFISIYIFFSLLIYILAGNSLNGTYAQETFNNKILSSYSNDSLYYRILLIGDAGEPSLNVQEPVLAALENEAKKIPDETTILFLGDNIYPSGMPSINDPERKTAEEYLDEQIKVVQKSKAKGIFIPGNHDWGNGSDDGAERIIRQFNYIIKKGDSNLAALPVKACPGPIKIDYGNKLRVIIFDSQWWLQNYIPDSINNNCNINSKSQLMDSLKYYVKTANGRFVIVADHHPLNSYGPHGGFFSWKDHLFPLTNLNKYLYIPLPIIGSLYPLSRNLGISRQDLSNPVYQDMIEKIKNIIANDSNLVFVSGHEHSLQILKGKGNYYLISGFGTSEHHEKLSYGKKTIFAGRYPGFMEINIFNNGKAVVLVFKSVGKDSSKMVFSMSLN